MSKTSQSDSMNDNRQGKLTALFFVAAVLIFAFSGWSWWHNVRSNPTRTLYAAINNNLRTRSLTRHVVQDSGSQKLEQDVKLILSPEAIAQGSTTITQEGSVNATVKTESISTDSEEYVKYTKIQSDQKNADGRETDFTELLNIWGKTESAQTGGQPGELYGESVLGVILTANLDAHDREALMKVIRDNDVYQFDESTLVRKTENGRPVYVYDITVAPSSYITLLKTFGKMVGLAQLEGLDPQQYANAQPLEFKIAIDVWSQHVTEVEFAGGERSEYTSGFGINHEVSLPKDTIPVQELQQKLQQVQQ